MFALDDDRRDDALKAIAARRRVQASPTESIAARLTGLFEDALGSDRAATFLATDAYQP